MLKTLIAMFVKEDLSYCVLQALLMNMKICLNKRKYVIKT